MKWKRFDWESDGERGAVDFLNEIEQQGYEPRTIIPWARNSAGDPIGVTVYAREFAALEKVLRVVAGCRNCESEIKELFGRGDERA